jgi:hypothetical protein
LSAIRTLARLRETHPALHNHSAYRVVYAEPGRYPFAFLRQGGGERAVVAINPADRPVAVSLPADALPVDALPANAAACTLWGVEGGLARTAAGWEIALPGVSAGIYQI